MTRTGRRPCYQDLSSNINHFLAGVELEVFFLELMVSYMLYPPKKDMILSAGLHQGGGHSKQVFSRETIRSDLAVEE